MKRRFSLLVIILFPVFSVPAEKHDAFAKISGKKLIIPEANLELTLYGWEYYVDPKALDIATEEAYSTMDMTNAEATYSAANTALKFYLLEPADKIMHGFRTNINLVLDRTVKKGTLLSDYGESQLRGYGLYLPGTRIKDSRQEIVNGIPFFIVEYEYDSPNLRHIGKKVTCYMIAYMALINNRGYIFTASSLKEDRKIKRPLIEMVLGSLRYGKNSGAQQDSPAAPATTPKP